MQGWKLKVLFLLLRTPFAVLDNQHRGFTLILSPMKKIDVLKDLENARMKLSEHTIVESTQGDAMEEGNLPLENQNILEWASDESEEEPCDIVASMIKVDLPKKIRGR